MISRSTDIRAALRSRQRGFLLNPFRFGGGGGGGGGTVSYISSTVSIYATSTSISPTSPATITNDDALFAFVFTRSALTPPSGWTVLDSTALFTEGTISQYLHIVRKNSVASTDANTAFTFAQAVSARIGVNYIVARSSTGTVTVAEIANLIESTVSDDGINPPVVTATTNGELVLISASCVALTPVTNVAPSGSTLYTVLSSSDNRLAGAYQNLDASESTSGGEFVITGSTATNGFGSIVARLQAG